MEKKQEIKYEISVVTPLYNEEKNITLLFLQIKKALTDFNRSFEFIFVNDGSNDKSSEILKTIYNENDNVSVINLYRSKGKAAGLEVGVGQAKGRYIVIVDCDLQYDANDIPKMILELEKGFDVVSGRRERREDSLLTKTTSYLFNWIIRRISGLHFYDFFSGLKCFNREVTDYLALIGDLYRFATVYAFKQRFKVKELPVNHYPRIHGKSRYNFLKRFFLSIGDIITVIFTITFNRDRVYYIELLGYLFFSLSSFLLCLYWLFFKGYWESTNIVEKSGLLLLFTGIQAFILQKMSSSFFDRHEEKHHRRKWNLKNICTHQ